MITSKLVTTLRPVVLAALCAALSFAGEVVSTRTTLVVKADARSGRLIRSVTVAPRVISSELPDSEVDQVEPSPAAGDLHDVIDAIAAKHDIEGSLVHSVIKAESNYNPLALSPKGAQGLMQLIPATARRFGVENSFNAQQNIEGGVKYLKFLMELYHNDYVKVIAAYNAGEGAVTKYGGIPPYAETRNYVQQVGKNLMSARKSAEIRKIAVAEKKPTTSPEASHPIIAATGADGRLYYKTQ